MEIEKRSSELKNASWSIFIISFIIYAVISMTKSAYSASMASIISDGIFKTSSAGIINTGFYVFYGGAQLLGVGVVDKVSPIKLVYITLAGTLISIIGMSFAKTFAAMLILWSFCGLIQFAIWPAILRIIAEYVLVEHRQKAMILISFAYCVGMLINYLIASVVLGVSNWRVLFVVSGGFVALCMILWFWITKKTKKQRGVIMEENHRFNAEDVRKKESGTVGGNMGFLKVVAVSGVIFLVLPSLFRAAMDVGLKSWVPKMMIDVYGISDSLASSFTTILVAVNLTGVFIAGWIHQRIAKNTAFAFGLCFLISVPFNIVLLFTGKIHVIIVVALLTVVTTMMYAAHQLINVVIPSSFARFNKTGSVAAMLNAIASFGNAAAAYGFGYIAEKFGWISMLVMLLAFAVIAFVFSVIAVPFWAKFQRNRVII